MISKVNNALEEQAMKKTATIISLLALCAASPAMAGKASKQENVGVGAGVAIGAAAGGPVGAIIGAAIGAKLGDKMHKKSHTIDSLNASLAGSRSDLDAVSAELAHIKEIDRPALINLMEAGIAMDVLFRTDEYVLADTNGDRLAQLAQRIAAMPDIRIRLDGFADERGDAEYNQDLSQKRVDYVREQLISAGVDASRIDVAAHGEAPAQDDTPDSYALERRVSLHLFIDGTQSFAANPN